MRRLVAVFAALLCLGACGGGSGTGDGGGSATTAGGAGGSPATTTLASGAVSGSEYCTLARSYAKAFERFGQPGTSADQRAYYQSASADINKAVSVAPAEIKGEVQTMAGVLQSLVTALESINYDFTRVSSLPPDLIAKLMDRQFIDAATKVSAYSRDKCGIA